MLFQMLWVIAESWKGYESGPTEWKRAQFVVVKNLGYDITVSGHKKMSLWSENTCKPGVWFWSQTRGFESDSVLKGLSSTVCAIYTSPYTHM